MKERPILFSAPMVHALLAGTKTQTRRVLRVQPPAATREMKVWHHPEPRPHFFANDGASLLEFALPCPYGQPGDRLYVRETFAPIYPQDPNYNGGRPIEYDYRATYMHGDRLGDMLGVKKTWKPAIHMPRVASRILLEITSVRAEHLQDISEADARAEGITDGGCTACGMAEPCGCATQSPDARDSYFSLWEQINGAGSWNANPWVWVVEFKVLP